MVVFSMCLILMFCKFLFNHVLNVLIVVFCKLLWARQLKYCRPNSPMALTISCPLSVVPLNNLSAIFHSWYIDRRTCWRDSAVWSWGTSRVFKHNEFKVKSVSTKCVVSEMYEWCWWLAVDKSVVMVYTVINFSQLFFYCVMYRDIHLWNYFCDKMGSVWQFKVWISFSQQHLKTT